MKNQIKSNFGIFNNIEVWKLGGKALKDPFCIRETAENVTTAFKAPRNIVVVSAIGGITQMLISLFEAKKADNKKEMHRILRSFNRIHRKVVRNLFGRCDNYVACAKPFELMFKKLNNLAYSENFDDAELYASLLQFGELVNSNIFSMYLEMIGVPNHWFDPRPFIKTEGINSKATLRLPESQELISAGVTKLLEEHKTLVTAGFIASNLDSNRNSILDLDGSDDSAAIITVGVHGRVRYIKDIDGISSDDNPIPGDTRNIYKYVEKDHYYERFEGKKAPVRINSIRILAVNGNPTRISSYRRPDQYSTDIIY